MGIRSAKVCGSPKIFFAAWSLATCRGPSRAGLQVKSSNILMHINSAKTTALPTKNWTAGRRWQRWFLPQQSKWLLSLLMPIESAKMVASGKLPEKDLHTLTVPALLPLGLLLTETGGLPSLTVC